MTNRLSAACCGPPSFPLDLRSKRPLGAALPTLSFSISICGAWEALRPAGESAGLRRIPHRHDQRARPGGRQSPGARSGRRRLHNEAVSFSGTARAAAVYRRTHNAESAQPTILRADALELNLESRLLLQYIRHLRKKIEQDPARREYLLTEPWVGYRFRNPADPECPLSADHDSEQ